MRCYWWWWWHSMLLVAVIKSAGSASPLIKCEFQEASKEFKILVPGAAPGEASRGPLVFPPAPPKKRKESSPKDKGIVQGPGARPGDLPHPVKRGKFVWTNVKLDLFFVRSETKNFAGKYTWTEYHDDAKFAMFEELFFFQDFPKRALVFDRSRDMLVSLDNTAARWMRHDIKLSEPPALLPNELAKGRFFDEAE